MKRVLAWLARQWAKVMRRNRGVPRVYLGGRINWPIPIQSSSIVDEYDARGPRTCKVDHRHVGPRCIYAIIMDAWDPAEVFESKVMQALLVSLDYAPASHGPALSDLTQLGYLESGGGGLYAFTALDPRDVDWTAEGRRLRDMRAERRRA